MKVAVLGLGMWGFCLARHLALRGHEVHGWEKNEQLLSLLARGEDHPHLHRSLLGLPITLKPTLSEVLSSVDIIVESVTTSGLREVFQEIHTHCGSLKAPLVLTSKGIEQKSHLMTPALALEIFGEEHRAKIALLSGPSFAIEVSQGLPTAVVCGAFDVKVAEIVVDLFSSSTFRVYPNGDIFGVALGGALKNIIAIACGIADGLELGTGARAALITRGLHEMIKIAVAEGCQEKTLCGLSGLGDLVLTCSSPLSRNFRFGKLLSEGVTVKEAEKHIGMVVEGAYTAKAARGLAAKRSLPMPITELISDILDGKFKADEAVDRLMLRSIKEEHL